jgi:hypothetical protein
MQMQLTQTDRPQEGQQTDQSHTQASATEADHAATDALLDEIDLVLDQATIDAVEADRSAARSAYREKLQSLTIGRRPKSRCAVSLSCTLCSRSC